MLNPESEVLGSDQSPRAVSTCRGPEALDTTMVGGIMQAGLGVWSSTSRAGAAGWGFSIFSIQGCSLPVGIGQREVMTLQLPLIEAGLGLSHECLAARPPVLKLGLVLQNLPPQPHAQNNKKLDNPRNPQSQAPNETSRAKGHRHRPGIPAPRLAAEAGRPRIWGFLSFVGPVFLSYHGTSGQVIEHRSN